MMLAVLETCSGAVLLTVAVNLVEEEHLRLTWSRDESMLVAHHKLIDIDFRDWVPLPGHAKTCVTEFSQSGRWLAYNVHNKRNKRHRMMVLVDLDDMCIAQAVEGFEFECFIGSGDRAVVRAFPVRESHLDVAQVWDVSTGHRISTLQDCCNEVAQSLLGGRFVIGTSEHIFRAGKGRMSSECIALWDVETGKRVQAWCKKGQLRCVSNADGEPVSHFVPLIVSPCGTRVATTLLVQSLLARRDAGHISVIEADHDMLENKVCLADLSASNDAGHLVHAS